MNQDKIIAKLIKKRAKAKSNNTSYKVTIPIIVEKYETTPEEARAIITQVAKAEGKQVEVTPTPVKPKSITPPFIDEMVAPKRPAAKKVAAKKVAQVINKAPKQSFYFDPDTEQPKMLRIKKETSTAIIYELDKPRLVDINVGGTQMTVNEKDVLAAVAASKPSYKGAPISLVKSAMELALVTL